MTNNLLANIPGTALDAVQGKILSDKISVVGNPYEYRTIKNLTNINQFGNEHRFIKVENIDNDYAKEIGILRNTGDFHACVLHYNGDGTNFNYGNVLLSSPLLEGSFYLISVWNCVAKAIPYGNFTETIEYLNNWIWTSGTKLSISGYTATLCIGLINTKKIYAKKVKSLKFLLNTRQKYGQPQRH